MANVAFWDVDTQQDFMLPDGKVYVKGAERLRANLKKLYAAARKHRLPCVATVDAHTPQDKEMQVWPVHCVKGTEAQKKLPETRLVRRIVVPYEKPSSARLRPGLQVILEKCHLDGFSNPTARELVLKSDVGRWIVFGVATDYALRLAVLGLLKLGRAVTVVSDAIQGAAAGASRQAIIEMQAAGADFRTTAAVLKDMAPSTPRKVRKT